MQISQVKQEELGYIINGLRAVWYQNPKDQKGNEKLLKQMEGELSQRYGLTLREPA